MSPLWRDEVAVYLGQRRLRLVRRARGLRARATAATEIEVPAGAPGDVGPTLARLSEVLAEPTWHGATARAVVADSWVRYEIVPWPEIRLDAAGRLAQARYQLADAHGDTLADWRVALGDTPPGRSCVACAMPSGLQGALVDTLASARLTLVSLQPQLVVAFNAWRLRLPAAATTWFVVLDEEWLSAAHLSEGAWDRVHMARLSQDWWVELERLQAFGRLSAASGAPGRMFIHAPAWMRRSAPASAGVEWLEGRSGGGAPGQALALLERTSP